MAETGASIPIVIFNNVTKHVENPPRPMYVNNEDIVDPNEVQRLNDVVEPVLKLPIDAGLENTDNETIVNLEIADSKQKPIATNLLNDVFTTTDEGQLRGEKVNNSEANRNALPSYLNVNYGSKRNRNPICVQFMESSGEEMDEDSRRPFILIVFALLFVCLLLTLGFAVFTFLVPGVRTFFAGPIGLILSVTGSVLLIISSYKIICYEYGRRCPCNVFGLLTAVVAECLIFGFLSARFRLKVVLLALGVSCVVVLFCIGLALTPLDFTRWYIFVIIIGLVLAIFSLIVFLVSVILKETFPILYLVLSCCFVLYQIICVIIQLQLILGGKSVELDETEYFVGAFLLYTAIMTLIFDIIRCLGLMDYLGFLDDL